MINQQNTKFSDHFYTIDVSHIDIQNAHNIFKIFEPPKKLLAKI